MKYILLLVTVFTHFAVFSQDTLDIGQDTSICTNESVIVNSNLIGSQYTYLWNTMDSIDFITVDTTGEYSLIVSYTDSLITNFDSLLIFYNTDTIFTDSTMMEIDTIVTDTLMIDSTFTIINYFDTLQVDTILIEIRNVPISDFSSEIICFPESTPIYNNSIFNDGSTVEYLIQGLPSFTNTDTLLHIFLANGESKSVEVTIDQDNGCTSTSTFTISNKLKPNGGFSLDPTCENEQIVFTNISDPLTVLPESTVEVFDGITLIESFNNNEPLELDTLADGTYMYTFIVSNPNNCSDTVDYSFDVLKTNYVAFTIEDNSGINEDDLSYCQFDQNQLIQSYDIETGSNFSGGIFTHPYVLDNNNGTAFLVLDNVDTNFDIMYEYTNSFGCMDLSTLQVNDIFPLPIVELAGLKDEFCLNDSSVNITGNQPTGEFEISPDVQNVFESIDGLSAIFNPVVAGTYNLSYEVTDINGCSNQIIQESIVHPLPIIDLPADEFLLPNSSLIIGDPSPNSNVDYFWSTGETTNQIEVESPGVYVVTAYNNVTTCEASDTITVTLIVGLENSLDSAPLIYPNPFTNFLTLSFTKDKTYDYLLFDSLGRQVLKGRLASSNEFTINTENLESGVYFLQLENDVYRIVKI